jgi:hypothetical protein
MMTGKRLALEIDDRDAAHTAAVFDVTGFEYANFDILRRFVFV